MALGPVVAHGVGEDLAVGIESALGDGLIHGLTGLQLGAGVLVPEAESAIGADGHKGAVHRVECYVIHGINVLEARGARGAVALEGEVVFGIRRIDVL